ncbi:hypothetical protein Y032_0030g2155 [Ancylostoma ceylanicum]|uniref:Uncharacterized protein n=1 Tax=Ancylostoma ceylanicum TaxID=53326 RepID=A0A016US18_9BILA|nr:hypothetical protein Y032_0030g2155 [Ancylostoma ceylanicum]
MRQNVDFIPSHSFSAHPMRAASYRTSLKVTQMIGNSEEVKDCRRNNAHIAIISVSAATPHKSLWVFMKNYASFIDFR